VFADLALQKYERTLIAWQYKSLNKISSSLFSLFTSQSKCANTSRSRSKSIKRRWDEAHLQGDEVA